MKAITTTIRIKVGSCHDSSFESGVPPPSSTSLVLPWYHTPIHFELEQSVDKCLDTPISQSVTMSYTVLSLNTTKDNRTKIKIIS